MKSTYKKPASGGKGYTASERKSMSDLIRAKGDPFGDVTGGSSISVVIKKKPKKMASGGIVGKPARSYKDMKAGAGSGVGRIQKSKIASRGR